MQSKDEIRRIFDVADRYGAYFEEWGADIAIGRNGPNFFYVLDEGFGEFSVFSPFGTAEELEALIMGDIADRFNAYAYQGTESRLKAMTLDSLNDVYDNYFPDRGMCCLLRDLKVLAEENAKWCDFMGKTYRSLAGILEKQ